MEIKHDTTPVIVRSVIEATKHVHTMLDLVHEKITEIGNNIEAEQFIEAADLSEELIWMVYRIGICAAELERGKHED